MANKVPSKAKLLEQQVRFRRWLEAMIDHAEDERAQTLVAIEERHQMEARENWGRRVDQNNRPLPCAEEEVSGHNHRIHALQEVLSNWDVLLDL